MQKYDQADQRDLDRFALRPAQNAAAEHQRQTPDAVNRTMRAAPVTANSLMRGYCSAAAAMMKGVNGNGGGAMDATISAHAALLSTFPLM